MGGTPPQALFVEFPGALLFWLFRSRGKRTFPEELKSEENKVWHAALGAVFWLALMLAAVWYFSRK